MTTQDDKHQFFGRENLIRAGWVVLLGVGGFGGAAVYHKFVAPQKFVIDDQGQSPIRVIIAESDMRHSSHLPEIDSLTAELKMLRQMYDRQLKQAGKRSPPARIVENSVKSYIDPDAPRLQNLTEEVKRLREALVKEKAPTVPAIQMKGTDLATPPEFQLPPNVKGYIAVRSRGIENMTCPQDVNKKSEPVAITFDVADTKLVKRATPLFVHIIQKRGDGALYQVFDELAQLKDGHNKLTFNAEIPAGTYYMEYGYYVRSELNQEFPNYYSHKCNFSIQI